jgi:hypothetical protein
MTPPCSLTFAGCHRNVALYFEGCFIDQRMKDLLKKTYFSINPFKSLRM